MPCSVSIARTDVVTLSKGGAAGLAIACSVSIARLAIVCSVSIGRTDLVTLSKGGAAGLAIACIIAVSLCIGFVFTVERLRPMTPDQLQVDEQGLPNVVSNQMKAGHSGAQGNSESRASVSR